MFRNCLFENEPEKLLESMKIEELDESLEF